MTRRHLLTIEERKAIPFVLPGFIITIILIIYPLFYIFTMSFRQNAFGQSGFAGFRNYLRLFNNPQFGQAMANTVVWVCSSVVLSFVMGLTLALLINNEGIKYKGFWRSILFIAWIFPVVVKATTWRWLLSYDGGMINHMLQSIGIIDAPVPWLISPKYSMISVIMVHIWSSTPYVMLMMTAGLQQISKDLYESADIDGANPFQKIFRITLPMLKDIAFICILLLLVWAINGFNLIWLMTSGGPAGSTTTLSIMVYNQFKVLNLNAASASAVMQLIISMTFAGAYVLFVQRRTD